MWQEIYLWLEQYSGVSYNFDEDITRISKDFVFIEPYEWISTIDVIIEGMSEAVDTVETYGGLLPEDFPDKDSLKRLISSNIISKILNNINYVKRQLHIDPIEIHSFNKLVEHANGLVGLINLLTENTIDDIIQHNMFEKSDEEYDNIFTEDFNMHSSDLTNMSFTVSSIRENYFDSLED